MVRNHRAAALVCVLTLICNSLAGWADLPNRMETIVVTASRTGSKLAAQNHSISVVGRDQLDLIAHSHISEALTRVPGTWISRGNGQEHLTAIRSPVLSGPGSCAAFLMLEDGIPLRSAGFCNVNELFEAGSESAGRIEVIRGPGIPAYGANAMHGLVNVISPVLPDEPSREVSLAAGSHGFARLALQSGDPYHQISLEATREEGYKDDSGYGQQKAKLQFRTRIGDADATTRLAVNNLNQETAGFIEGHNSYRNSGAKRDNPNPEAFRDAYSLRWHTDILWQGGGQSRLGITPFLRYTDMDFLQHFLPGKPREHNGHWSLGVQSYWQRPLQTNVLLSSGLDVEYTDSWLEEYQRLPTVSDSPVVRATIPKGYHYDFSVQAESVGAYTQFEWNLTERLRLTPGVRFDLVRYVYDNRMIDGRTRDDGTPCAFGGCRFNRPADRQDQFVNWSPRIGANLNLGQQGQLYVSLVRGFRAPHTAELYRLQDTQSVTHIESESLTSVEAGWRGSRSRLGWDLSLYTMRKDNVISRDSNRNIVDVGETSHHGLEWSLTLDIGHGFELATSGTFARHRYEAHELVSGVDIIGNDVPSAPRHMGSIQLSRESSAGLQFELEWVHMGRYQTDAPNLHDYPGHDLIHLRLAKDLPGGWRARLGLLNLTSVDYAERADFAFGVDRYFVGQPLTIQAGIDHRW